MAVGLVPQLRDAVYALAADQAGDLLDKRRLVSLVRQLVYNDLVATSPGHLLDVGARPDEYAPPPVRVGCADRVPPLARGALAVGRRQPHSLVAEEHAPGGEVRPKHNLRKVRGSRLRVLNQAGDGVAHLAQVVGRDVRGHTHSDTGGPVHQQVG